MMLEFLTRSRTAVRFRARSAGRDQQTDRSRVAAVSHSIEAAIVASIAEQAGLEARINEILARAAVTQGNDSDEYLTRDAEDTRYLGLLGTEIENGQRRLNELKNLIEDFQFLKSVMSTRFS